MCECVVTALWLCRMYLYYKPNIIWSNAGKCTVLIYFLRWVTQEDWFPRVCPINIKLQPVILVTDWRLISLSLYICTQAHWLHVLYLFKKLQLYFSYPAITPAVKWNAKIVLWICFPVAAAQTQKGPVGPVSQDFWVKAGNGIMSSIFIYVDVSHTGCILYYYWACEHPVIISMNPPWTRWACPQ